jgi:GTPase
VRIIRDIITCHSDDSNAGKEKYRTFHYTDTLTNITDVGIAKWLATALRGHPFQICEFDYCYLVIKCNLAD